MFWGACSVRRFHPGGSTRGMKAAEGRAERAPVSGWTSRRGLPRDSQGGTCLYLRTEAPSTVLTLIRETTRLHWWKDFAERASLKCAQGFWLQPLRGCG